VNISNLLFAFQQNLTGQTNFTFKTNNAGVSLTGLTVV